MSGRSERTVKRHWQAARAFLFQELSAEVRVVTARRALDGGPGALRRARRAPARRARSGRLAAIADRDLSERVRQVARGGLRGRPLPRDAGRRRRRQASSTVSPACGRGAAARADRSLPCARAARTRRHGRGPSRRARRRPVRPARRDQAPAAAAWPPTKSSLASRASAGSSRGSSTRTSRGCSTGARRRTGGRTSSWNSSRASRSRTYCRSRDLTVEERLRLLAGLLRRRRGGAPQPRRASGPQAIQRPGHEGRRGQAPRLRHREAPRAGRHRRGRGRDAHGAAPPHARVRGARADSRRAGDDGDGRLGARGPRIRAADRNAAAETRGAFRGGSRHRGFRGREGASEPARRARGPRRAAVRQSDRRRPAPSRAPASWRSRQHPPCRAPARARAAVWLGHGLRRGPAPASGRPAGQGAAGHVRLSAREVRPAQSRRRCRGRSRARVARDGSRGRGLAGETRRVATRKRRRPPRAARRPSRNSSSASSRSRTRAGLGRLGDGERAPRSGRQAPPDRALLRARHPGRLCSRPSPASTRVSGGSTRPRISRNAPSRSESGSFRPATPRSAAASRPSARSRCPRASSTKAEKELARALPMLEAGEAPDSLATARAQSDFAQVLFWKGQAEPADRKASAASTRRTDACWATTTS